MDKEKNIWFKKSENANMDYQRDRESYFGVLELNNDDQVLIGASELGGCTWMGSLWLFQTPEDVPIKSRSLAGVDLDIGASDAKFVPKGNQVLVADYSGDLSLYDITRAADDCPVYFTGSSAFIGHDSYVTSLAVGSSESFVSASLDCSIIIWDIETQFSRSKYQSAHADVVTGVSLQPEQDVVFATTSQDNLALIWDPRCDKPSSKLAESDVSYTCLDWLDTQTSVLCDESGHFDVVDLRTRTVISSVTLSEKNPIRRVSVNRSNKVIAFAVDDPSIRVSQWTEGGLAELMSVHTTDMIRGLSWSEKTGLLHTCGWESQFSSHSIPPEKIS